LEGVPSETLWNTMCLNVHISKTLEGWYLFNWIPYYVLVNNKVLATLNTGHVQINAIILRKHNFYNDNTLHINIDRQLQRNAEVPFETLYKTCVFKVYHHKHYVKSIFYKNTICFPATYRRTLETLAYSCNEMKRYPSKT